MHHATNMFACASTSKRQTNNLKVFKIHRTCQTSWWFEGECGNVDIFRSILRSYCISHWVNTVNTADCHLQAPQNRWHELLVQLQTRQNPSRRQAPVSPREKLTLWGGWGGPTELAPPCSSCSGLCEGSRASGTACLGCRHSSPSPPLERGLKKSH